jgi:hypothetical protein
MGVFIDQIPVIFSNISNTPTVLVDTAVIGHPVQVESLSVCNTGTETIRLNVKRTRGATSVFVIKEFEIKPFQTVEIIDNPNISSNVRYMLLQYLSTPFVVSEVLTLFTNGSIQICDCTISYAVIKELP